MNNILDWPDLAAWFGFPLLASTDPYRTKDSHSYDAGCCTMPKVHTPSAQSARAVRLCVHWWRDIEITRKTSDPSGRHPRLFHLVSPLWPNLQPSVVLTERLWQILPTSSPEKRPMQSQYCWADPMHAWCEGDDWCKVLVYICNEILVRIQPNIINRRLTTLSDASMLDVLPAWRSRKNFLCFCTQIPRLLSCLRVTTQWPCFSLNSMSWSYWEDGDKESQMGEGHTHDTHKNTC